MTMHSGWGLALVALVGAAQAQPVVAWFNEPGGSALALDGSDNVYTARGEVGPAGDIFVAKRTAAGVVQWEVRHDNLDNTRHELPQSVAVAAGAVLVAGTVRSGFSSPVNAHAVLMKFSASGQLLWRRVLGADFDGGSAWRVLGDTDGHAYVYGLGMGPAGLVASVRKVSPAGEVLWSWFDTVGLGAPLHAKWSGDGHLLLTGRVGNGSLNGHARLDRNGQLRWHRTAVVSASAGDLAGDAAGQLYLLQGDHAGTGGSLVRKLGVDGQELWVRSHPMVGFRIELGPDGAPVIGGFPGAGQAGAAFAKFDAQGNLLWTQADADGPSAALVSHAHMVMDGQGAAYLAGSNLSQTGVVKVQPNGQVGWSMLLSGGAPAWLAVGTARQAVVTGGVGTARINASGAAQPPRADAAVTLVDSPDPLRVGAVLTLTATVRNAGPAAAAAVSLNTALPAGYTWLSSASSLGSCTGNAPVKCALGNLAAGAQATVTVKVRARTAGTFTTKATLTTTSAESNLANNSSSVVTQVQP